MALDAVDLGTMFARESSGDEVRSPFSAWRVSRRHEDCDGGWKLFLLLPRMLLHRPGRGGNISKTKLTSRFDDFSAGRWDVLISASEACDFGANVDPSQKETPSAA